ncbi:hypothetical protein CEK71_19525 [Methylovulum psychrotolerans]|uniref:Uncharacterized protein n=2 Tax=Methylovulum psychrotolerans TaxID=1704499 RepID=A0A1Z4C3K6_9GAMM|nr:hypothetical protein CEK71_19525 [Methylovulum psychrotolerans]
MIKEISRGQSLLYVSDWNWTDNIISILINKSDKEMSDPVFTDPREGTRRTAEKNDEEGQDFSVHIAIKLPIHDHESALAIVEHCTGLTVFTVQKLLNKILVNAKEIVPYEFEQLHPDGSVDNHGNPKKYNVSFKYDIRGHISHELEYDLDNGKIHSIELITDKEQHTRFDEEGYIQEKCKKLVLSLVDEGHPIIDKYNRILKVFNHKKDDYSRAKIKFETPTGISRTIEMDTIDGLAQAYVKKEKLDNFELDLKSSYDKFSEPILAKMKELLLTGA